MKLRYSPRAIGDLIAIAGYLQQRNPSAALAIERRIRAAADLLLDFPATGRPLDQRREVRVLPIAPYPYSIFYSAQDGEVIILHVRHGARRPISPEEL